MRGWLSSLLGRRRLWFPLDNLLFGLRRLRSGICSILRSRSASRLFAVGVLGSRRRSSRGSGGGLPFGLLLLLGSQANEVLTRSKVPVLIVR